MCEGVDDDSGGIAGPVSLIPALSSRVQNEQAARQPPERA
jgi:hypothetical protein